MKVTFVANFMNHHQLPFSENMIDLIGEDYTFVALEPIASEQSLLGYKDMNDFSFVIKAYENEELYQKSIYKILNDDVVIFGSCPNSLIALRMNQNKFSILYTERFFKKGIYRRYIPITYFKIYKRILKYDDNNIKIICSSAYAPYDFKLLGYNHIMYKWGYFPETYSYNVEKLIKSKSTEKIKILWVGRFIKLKHLDDALGAVNKLLMNGYNLEFNIIGRGKLEKKIKKQVEKNNMNSYVNFLGALEPIDVRKQMEAANIYMFTSDYNEGWGAVLNEAMNSGCAIIASHAIGSVPFLIEDGINGLVYKFGNNIQLFEKLKLLVDNINLREQLGRNAYITLNELWNARIATHRLYNLMTNWINDTNTETYDSGPCSIAPIVDHKWFNKRE